MSDRPMFAANWKMHMPPPETAAFVSRFRELYSARDDRRVAFFPPAVSLTTFAEAARGRPDLELGVQDVHQEGSGAHTGAISAEMAAAAGATLGLAGHSERRHEFGDTPQRVGQKLARLVEAGLAPILCVGETLAERKAGDLTGVLARQLEGALTELEPAARPGVAYAYEPVWAIGTGMTASADDAAHAHAILRERIAIHTDKDVAGRAVILYGGSVKPGNIASLLAAPGVNGVLVGGASLDPESFAAICGVE